MTSGGESRKVCPRCYKQYSEEDNYCGNDGARLVLIDFSAGPTGSRPDRASDPGARVVSSGAKKD
ncbi:MAG TPA: hypothetical protein VID27_21110 [Blastocatellia bacterium]|jgi:hypothetical protein